MEGATENDITVTNYPDLLKVNRGERDTPHEEFAPGLRMELWNKKLGIVGAGRIRLSIALKSKAALGMTVLVCDHCQKRHQRIEDPNYSPCSLDVLLRESDVVCIVAALNPQNERMIGKTELKLIKKSAIVETR